MNQDERLLYLINNLLAEKPEYRKIAVPADTDTRKRLLRSLVNVREPAPVSEEFLRVQDEYLQEELAKKKITRLENLEPLQPHLYLWRGDITTIAVDAIVNAANKNMLGCFAPCHGCIDNAIHTYAGVQLRQECAGIMQEQGHPEPTGQAKITKAYNLPCRYVIHTVGPIIEAWYSPLTAGAAGLQNDAESGQKDDGVLYDENGNPWQIVTAALSRQDRELLRSCYRSCLELAASKGLHSIAFCCISTGEFHFPNDFAADIAIRTVKTFQEEQAQKGEDPINVVFNVFKEKDLKIYQMLLS